MSVIRMTSSNARRTARNTTAGQSTIREADEFEGFWINVGPVASDGTFARLNRGIAVSDLQIRQIYETTDPARKAELALTNAVVRAIKSKANTKKIAEGEYIVLNNLKVVLYRRMEGSEGETTAALDAEVEALLFGDDDDETPKTPATTGVTMEDMDAEVERRVAERLAAQSKSKSRASQLMDSDDDVLGTTK